MTNEEKIKISLKALFYTLILTFVVLFRTTIIEYSSSQGIKGLIDLSFVLFAMFAWFEFLAKFEPEGEAILFNSAKPTIFTILSFQWREALKDFDKIIGDTIILQSILFLTLGILIFYIFSLVKKSKKIIEVEAESYKELDLLEKSKLEIEKNISLKLEDYHRKIKLIEELFIKFEKAEDLDKMEEIINFKKGLFKQMLSNLESIRDNSNYDQSVLDISDKNLEKVKIIIQKSLTKFSEFSNTHLIENQNNIKNKINLMEDLSLLINKKDNL